MLSHHSPRLLAIINQSPCRTAQETRAKQRSDALPETALLPKESGGSPAAPNQVRCTAGIPAEKPRPLPRKSPPPLFNPLRASSGSRLQGWICLTRDHERIPVDCLLPATGCFRSVGPDGEVRQQRHMEQTTGQLQLYAASQCAANAPNCASAADTKTVESTSAGGSAEVNSPANTDCCRIACHRWHRLCHSPDRQR